ncbi:hypothetical protein ACX93W_13575 [Paenibacillus sp. CAU 1782]
MKAWGKLLLALVLLFSLTACVKAFDEKKWIENREDRSSMVDSLQKKHELKGKTQEEIIGLLGEPDGKQEEPEGAFVYYLGRASYIGVDDSLLKFYFDEDGTVESYRITSD